MCMIPWRSYEPRPRDRTTRDVVYPHIKSPLARCIRNGYLCKRAQGETAYARAFFLVTSGFIHQFASSHFFERRQSIEDSVRDSARDNFVPQWSVCLDDCKVARYSESEIVLSVTKVYVQKERNESAAAVAPAPKQQSKGFASLFKSSNSSSESTIPATTQRRKSLVAVKCDEPIEVSFKIADSQPTADDIETFKKWVYDIKKLTSYSSIGDRAEYISQKISKIKRGSVTTKDGTAVNAPVEGSSSNYTTNAGLSLGKFALKEVAMGRKLSVDAVDPMEKAETAQSANNTMPLPNALPLPGVPHNNLLMHSSTAESAYTTSAAQARNPSSLSKKGGSPRYNSGSSQDSHGRTHAVAVHNQRRSTFGSLGMMKSRSAGAKANEPRVMDGHLPAHDDNELTLKLTSSLYSQTS